MRFGSIAVLVLASALLSACAEATAPEGEDDGVVLTDAGPDGLSPVDVTTSTIATHQLVGKVVDSSGVPVPEAQVSVGEATAITASDGWFDLETTTVGTIETTKPAWVGTETSWDGSAGFVSITMTPFKVRALRVGAAAAGDDEAFAELLRLADETAINGFVFDTKQEGGKVLYDTKVADAHTSGAVVLSYDPEERIAEAREHGLYVITRIVSFEDWVRAKSHPEEAFDGPWLDPTNRAAWEYPLALAVEACELGFDEIQFDYVRFPSGETVHTSGQLDMTQAERVGAIEGFLREARLRLHPMGCAVSADVFGIIVATANDQGIGQRPEELTRQLDALSPMVYPSHYSDGWIGLEDPNDHPYDVTTDAIEDALPRLDPGTVLRPWLQAFWWTNAEIRRSIQAAEDQDVGWILWNALSNFSSSAIPSDAEVTG